MKAGIRNVEAARGWRWIIEGFVIFRKNPAQWVLLTIVLFFGSRILYAIPVLGIVTMLVIPNFLAGLCHGAQALEEGKPLRLGYLASGFLKGAAPLITIGGISLVGKFLTMMVVILVAGESINDISRTMQTGTVTPDTVDAVRAAKPSLLTASTIGLIVYIPFVLATWFAPLLVFFKDVPPVHALALSLWACLRNILPFLVFGLAMLLPLIMLMPVGMSLRQPDLGLWLLAPVLVPSIYASYKDLFVFPPEEAAEVPQ